MTAPSNSSGSDGCSRHADPEAEEEEVLILYCSQRGSAEAAAESIARQLPTALAALLSRSDGHDPGAAPAFTPKLHEMDDWLMDRAETVPLTRLVVLVASSFGIGGAPMNGKLFRRRCDDILQHVKQRSHRLAPSDSESDPPAEEPCPDFLRGISFCMLGLGDSSYRTYMTNPQRIVDAWRAAGAAFVGDVGLADSHVARAAADADEPTDDQPEPERSGPPPAQALAINDWISGIWAPMADILREPAKLTLEQRIQATRALIVKSNDSC